MLFKRGFLTKKGRSIHSTEAGRILIQALPDLATQPDMTAHWESQLNGISQKSVSYRQFMAQLTQMLPDLVQFVNFSALRRLSQTANNPKPTFSKRRNKAKKNDGQNAE